MIALVLFEVNEIYEKLNRLDAAIIGNQWRRKIAIAASFIRPDHTDSRSHPLMVPETS